MLLQVSPCVTVSFSLVKLLGERWPALKFFLTGFTLIKRWLLKKNTDVNKHLPAKRNYEDKLGFIYQCANALNWSCKVLLLTLNAIEFNQEVLVNFPWISLMPASQTNSEMAASAKCAETLVRRAECTDPACSCAPPCLGLWLKVAVRCWAALSLITLNHHLFLMLFHHEPVSFSKLYLKEK